MNIFLFTPQEASSFIPCSDERVKHIKKVLHKQCGDSFEAGIINGQAGIATITELSNEGLRFSFVPKTDGKPLYPLTMIIGFPRPIQLKRLFRDIASLGVQTIHLTGTELGEKSYMQSSLVERGSATQMLVDGTVQAKSTHVPELFMHNSLKNCLSYLKPQFDNKKVLLVAPDNIRPQCSLSQLLLKDQSLNQIFAAIGSERGWSDNERKILEDSGFVLCSMGNRVLRTETAATVACTIILNQGLKVI